MRTSFNHSVAVSKDSFVFIESTGKREKFWFEDENQDRCMFKKNATPGEDWAEILACEIATLLNIPHAHYEFAHLVDAEDIEIAQGVITKSFVKTNQTLTLGNTLLMDLDPEYDIQEGNYKVKKHTIEAISNVISGLEPPLDESQDTSAAQHYASYLFLDVLIANQDRHHENWGVIKFEGKNYLAPTYDHASSFAWNVSDEKKQKRISTNDNQYRIDHFATKAKSAINASENGNTRLTTREALKRFCRYNDVSVDHWQNRLTNNFDSQLSDIIGGIPEQYMSEITKDFTFRLLKINKDYLLDL